MLLVSAASSTSSASSPSSSSIPPWAQDGVDVGALIEQLTVEQKVGQLLLLGFGGTTMDGTIATFLDEMQPGGVALFSRNIVDPEQTLTLVRAVREHDPRVRCGPSCPAAVPSSLPMFVSVDQEGGSVVRLKRDALILPSAMALGATDDPELARRVGRQLGEDLQWWGFNMNLAPVLDVNSNPRNPVIGVRSFGGDPARVGEVGVGYITGLSEAGVVAVAKHFPGHGDTDVDSHYAMPVLHHDRARLEAIELRPFARAFAAGLPAIMTAHIALPKIAESRDVPATVSAKVLTGVLRDELGWDGLVITDGLEMEGIVRQYGAGEAAVRAVVAGADMVMVLWFPEKKKEVQRALLDAVASGRLPMERLDQAVRRVLEQKARFGVFSRRLPTIAEASAGLQRADRRVLQEVALRAVTIVKNDDDVVPLKKPSSPSPRVVVAAPFGGFVRGLQRALNAQTVLLSSSPTKAQTEKESARIVALARAHDASVVVVGLQTSDHIAVVNAVKKALPRVKIVVVSFGSPWLINAFPWVDVYVCAFGWRDESAAAAADVVAGTKPARGRLPVVLAGGPAGEPVEPDASSRASP
jgi:beta-N-acetylhexosaminidase